MGNGSKRAQSRDEIGRGPGVIERLRAWEAWRDRVEARAREFDAKIERLAAGLPPLLD